MSTATQRVATPARTQWRPLRFLALLVGLTAAIVAGVCALPQSRYLRFNSLHEPSVVKAGWIYARIHFDPTPIDVVFLGTSHTVFGVDSADVERSYQAATGKHLSVVNFAIQHLGRNVTWLLAREALAARPVKLLVIEVMEDEPRDLHPAFAALADVPDLLAAPIVLNPSYLSDLAQLPLRQVSLAARTAVGDPDATFDAATYRGAHWDDTYAEQGSAAYPIVPAVPRTSTRTPAELAQERQHYARLVADKFTLPGPFRALETRANLIYLEKIVALAKRRQVPVRFLFLPSYGTTGVPRFAALYARAAPTWDPRAVVAPSDLWLDVNHLNHAGAERLSDWLGERLAQTLPP